MLKQKLFLLIGIAISLLLSQPIYANDQSTYYDTFYQDYNRTFPTTTKPTSTTPTPRPQQMQPYPMPSYQQPVFYPAQNPYMTQQTTTDYDSRYVPYRTPTNLHNTKNWEIDIKYEMGFAQFMFELDVGSILNWDEMDTKKTTFTVSRDFMIKNRQYMVKASYGTGDASTTRTSDDDVFNDAHILSIGKGGGDLTDWSIAIGMRNIYRLGGFDVTPMIGWKQKKQDLDMWDHTTPAPFHIEKDCVGATEANGGECGAINLGGVADDQFYYADPNTGEALPGTVTAADKIIPAGTLYYGDQIYAENFCYSVGSNTVCLKEGVDDSNLIEAFGGVSSAFTQLGFTHMYHVKWTGPFIGVNLERMFSPRETLLIYGEFFKPSYEVWGNWPNRNDWAHDPSFIDDGGSAWGVLFDVTYKYKIRSNIELTFGANFEYLKETDGDTTQYYADGTVEVYEKALPIARWKQFAIQIGVAFKL